MKNLSPLVKQFLDYLKLEKHFCDYTVKSYGADLIQFGQFLAGEIGQHARRAAAERRRPRARLDEKQLKCEPLTIREFLAYLYAQNYTKSTTARKLATLRSFYKFLIRRGLVQRQPAEHDPHAQAGKAPAQVPGPRAGAEAARRARRRRPARRPRQGDARSALLLRHPRQRTGRAGDGRPRSAGRRAPRPRQGPQGPPHADRHRRRSRRVQRYFELRSADAAARHRTTTAASS